MASKAGNTLDMNGFPIIGVPDTPPSGSSVVNKNFVDQAINGLDWKQSVRAATTGNITLSGAQTVDGIGLITGDSVLVKNQTTGSQNGVYLVGAGSWTRRPDADANAEFTAGLAVFVEEGTANGNQQWALTTDAPIVLGTTALTFAQVGAQSAAPAAGGGLTLGSNQYDVGAGPGIVVSADAVQVDTAVIPRKVSALVGDGAATSFPIAHNLDNQYPVVQVYEVSTGAQVVLFDVIGTSASVVTVTFGAAPTTGQYRVVVQG